jgi:hypothetical protein
MARSITSQKSSSLKACLNILVEEKRTRHRPPSIQRAKLSAMEVTGEGHQPWVAAHDPVSEYGPPSGLVNGLRVFQRNEPNHKAKATHHLTAIGLDRQGHIGIYRT